MMKHGFNDDDEHYYDDDDDNDDDDDDDDDKKESSFSVCQAADLRKWDGWQTPPFASHHV